VDRAALPVGGLQRRAPRAVLQLRAGIHEVPAGEARALGRTGLPLDCSCTGPGLRLLQLGERACRGRRCKRVGCRKHYADNPALPPSQTPRSWPSGCSSSAWPRAPARSSPSGSSSRPREGRRPLPCRPRHRLPAPAAPTATPAAQQQSAPPGASAPAPPCSLPRPLLTPPRPAPPRPAPHAAAGTPSCTPHTVRAERACAPPPRALALGRGPAPALPCTAVTTPQPTAAASQEGMGTQITVGACTGRRPRLRAGRNIGGGRPRGGAPAGARHKHTRGGGGKGNTKAGPAPGAHAHSAAWSQGGRGRRRLPELGGRDDEAARVGADAAELPHRRHLALARRLEARARVPFGGWGWGWGVGLGVGVGGGAGGGSLGAPGRDGAPRPSPCPQARPRPPLPPPPGARAPPAGLTCPRRTWSRGRWG
jgi:hypothetical protein